MKNLLLTTAFLTLILNQIYSQVNLSSSFLQVNNVKALFWNNGNNFWDHNNGSQFFVPATSPKTAFFAQNLWIGGYDSNDSLCFAGNRYTGLGNDFFPGPISNVYDSIYDQKWNKIWVLSKSEVESFIAWHNNPSAFPNYVIPNNILTWPAHGDITKGESANLAPFFDNNGDGHYTAASGDYPIFKGDGALLYFMNDLRLNHTETGGNKIGIEVMMMAYGYNCTNDLNNTIFMEYTINKRTNGNLDSTRIGIFADFDLGFGYDDFVGTDVSRGLIYAYNGNAVDGYGNNYHYGAEPPAIGISFLKGTPLPYDNLDNPNKDQLGHPNCDASINGLNFGDSIIDNEFSGLYGSVTFHNGGTIDAYSDPNSAEEYMKYMNFHWKNDQNFKYTGYGYDSINSTQLDCKYVFPGLTDSCNLGTYGIEPTGNKNWTEVTAANLYSDRRIVGVLEPTTLVPNTPIKIEYAIIWARDSVEQSIPALQRATDTVRYYYHHNIHPCGGNYLGNSLNTENQKPEITVFPNPSSSHLTLKITGNESYFYEIYSITGKRVQSGKTSGESTTLDISPLSDGLYFIRVSSNRNINTIKFIKTH